MDGQKYEIKNLIEGDVDFSKEAIKLASRDASIFEVKPAGTIAPKNTDDIKAVIKYVSRKTSAGKKMTITPRAGGTCMSGGSLTQGLVLNMTKYLNKIGDADEKNLKLTVQGGAWHKDIEKATHPKGLLFAPYTSSHEICSIGGMIGNNASGEKSVRYGATDDNVKKLKVVLYDGNEYEFGPLSRLELKAKMHLPNLEGDLYSTVVGLLEKNTKLIEERRAKTAKNAAGYELSELWNKDKTIFNMARLFIGAQGTLGVVTEAELDLVQMLAHSRMIVTPIEDLDQLPEVVQTVLKFQPAACETFDHFTFDWAKKYHPAAAKKAFAAESQHMVVLSVFEDNNKQEADKMANAAKKALENLGHKTERIDDEPTIESFLNIRRWSFKMLLEHPAPDTRAMAFLEDTIVPIEKYGDFLRKLETILTDYDMTYTYAGHIAAGSIRLIPLVNMEADGAAERIMELETKVNDLVLEFGGSISVDHNDGIIRTPFLEKQFGSEMIKLFEEIKDLFDPLGIFNPGKKVRGTYEYALEHIIRDNG